MVRTGTACMAAVLVGGMFAAMAGAAMADPPVEITVGKENAKRTIVPGAGKDAAQSFRDCPNCPEMVVVPAGAFMMGSPENEPGRKKSEGPQHKDTFAKPFAVGKFEVIWADWAACEADNRCYTHKERDEKWGFDKRPVINMDKEEDFRSYLLWLQEKTGKDYRLLSEAEWEYAARAGTTSPYFTGATISKQQARFNEEPWSADSKTADAGSFLPNAWGLHDMHGNVWEWVQDCWHATYKGAPADGSAWAFVARPGSGNACEEYVLRGGSWSSDPKFVRSASRTKYNPTNRINFYGFRVARSLD
jgi:formylglycine-generating enzyme required for sulfatase activity